MNTEKVHFRLAIKGFTETHLRVIRSICWLSNSRSRTYKYVEELKHAQLLLLNANSQNVVTYWNNIKNTSMAKSIIPVWIGTKENIKDKKNGIVFPIIAIRVLNELDKVTINDLHYAPELMIGEESNINLFSNMLITNKKAVTGIHDVLVVDDSAAIRKQIEIELNSFNLSADFAESGEAAIDLIKKHSYRLVLLDVVMPGVDGYKVCKIIKKSKLNNIAKVLMLTGRSSPFDRLRGSLAGCDSYLTKPVSHARFRKIIKKYRVPTRSEPNQTIVFN